MPREDSIGSSGGSLTSDEEDAAQQPQPSTSNPTDNAGVPSASTTLGRTGVLKHTPALNRFRNSVNKVVQMNRIQGAFNPVGQPGAEPGIDPKRPGSDEAYGHIKEHCEIEVTDYSSTKYDIQQYDNAGFVQLMKTTGGRRPEWAKVRWINIAGISWDVLSHLGVAYKLHPLTLENVLSGMRTARSKADYYTNHLFLHILCQSLADKESAASPLAQMTAARSVSPAAVPSLRRRFSPHTPDIEKGVEGDDEKPAPAPVPAPRTRKQRSKMTTMDRRTAAEDRIKAADAANNLLRDNQLSVNVVTKSLFLYLLRDGTVISIHQADRGFGDPIYNRLRTPNTILRASSDPSLLIEALLDLVVDRALDIVDRFHENILKCERSILLRPKMSTVRELHFLSAELTARRRELDPVKTLIYGLRRYDVDRCAAVAESSGTLVDGAKVQGFLSHKAKIYLADVHEHCEWIMTSFEMFETISENLISYTFNIIAYDQNSTMKVLTLVTIVCLPLTLLTGYFGMNFATFPGVQDNSDQFFWIIGGPLFAAFVLVCLWPDLSRVWHYLQKKTVLARLDHAKH